MEGLAGLFELVGCQELLVIVITAIVAVNEMGAGTLKLIDAKDYKSINI